MRGMRTRRMGLVAAGVAGCGLFLGGCNDAASGMLSGAALGSLTGMGLGSLSGNMGKGAAAGALIGGAMGAVIGDQNQRADNRAYRANPYYHGNRYPD